MRPVILRFRLRFCLPLLAALLPAELQKMSVLSAGVFKSSAQADAGKSFIAFLATADAERAFKAAGFDPI